MKSTTKLGLFSLFMAVALVGAGCKKTPKNVTPIPRGDRYGSAPIVTDVQPTQSLGQTPTTGTPYVPPNNGNLTGNRLNNGGNVRSQDLPQVTAVDPETGAEATGGLKPLPDIDLAYGHAIDRTLLGTATVYFEYDRFNIRASEADKVKEVAKFLKENSSHNLVIEGHCDERGTEEYNRALGERRALSVRENLISLGVSAGRITTRSFGEDQPAHPGQTEEAYALNRRAEFVVLLPNVQ